MSGSQKTTIPARPATEYGPRSLSAETSALNEALALALPAALAAHENRIALRLQTAAKAEQSAELTHAQRSAKRSRTIAITLGTTLGVVLSVFSTAWSVFRDARAQAIDVAQRAEAKAQSVEEQITAGRDYEEKNSEAIRGLREDVDAIEAAVARLVVLLEPREASSPPKKRR